MKQIMAFIRPHSAERLFDSLRDLPLIGPCVIREVKGFGRQKSYLNEYSAGEYASAYVSKVFLKFVVEDEDVEQAITLVIEKTRTGRIGDGKIFIASVAQDTDFFL